MKARLSPKDWRMLSEYLDEQLAPKQRSRMEERLRASTQLQQALDELRSTRLLLRSTPRRRVPHNFILTPEMLKKGRRTASPWLPAFSVTSALAALVTIAILLFEYSPAATLQPIALIAPAAPEAEVQTQKEAPSSKLEPSPPVIYWGGAPPAADYLFQEGLGGGCDNCETTPLDNMSQPESAPGLTGVFETLPQPAAPFEKEAEEPAATISTQTFSAPEIEAEQYSATPSPILRDAQSESQPRGEMEQPAAEVAEDGKQAIRGTEIVLNPILGLEPDRGSKTSTPFLTTETVQEYEPRAGLGITPFVTAFIAILSGLAAWFIWKRSKK